MDWRFNFAEIVKNDFNEKQKKNHRFSQKAYSKKLGISASTLSDILTKNKNWEISVPRAKAILSNIGIDEYKKNKLLIQMGVAPEYQKREIAQTQLKVISEWYYLPVLLFFDLPVAYRDIKLISKKLGLTVSKVRSIVKELLELGMLVKDEEGSIYCPPGFARAEGGVPPEILKRANEQNLELSRKVLKEGKSEDRDFTFLTFTGSRKKMELLKKEIRQVYEKAALIVDDKPENDTVFRLSVQFSALEMES